MCARTPSLYLLTETCHSPSPHPRPSFRLGTPKIGAVCLLLLPRLFVFSCPLLDTQHHRPRIPQAIHLIATVPPPPSQGSQKIMFVKQIVTPRPEWCTNPPHPTDTSQAHPSPAFALAVATTLHLVLLTHLFHGPKICP